MVYSMTGYGRGTASSADRKITVEIKSLNSKQLDLNMKIPGVFREVEGTVRNMLLGAVERGKVEFTLSSEFINPNAVSSLNLELLKTYKEQIEKMDRELGIAAPQDWHTVLLRLPDVLKGDNAELCEEDREACLRAAEEAVKDLKRYRLEEGKKLYEFFVEKISAIRGLLGEVERYEKDRVAKIKSRMIDQLEKISGVEYDAGRLEQELIYYIEKLDVSEEKQRLDTHLTYFIETLGPDNETAPASKGKKLGFIAQEMGREINTLGSKSNNAEMQIVVVKMKDELEQIKEQVLNVL